MTRGTTALDHGERSALANGHRLGEWLVATSNGVRNECIQCGAEVEVRFTQLPGDYITSGRATEKPCVPDLDRPPGPISPSWADRDT